MPGSSRSPRGTRPTSTRGTTRSTARCSMERVDAEGREPYTWVRTQGKGRVFYTAFGHDERTWGNPGFQQLIEQGTRLGRRRARRGSGWQRLKMPDVDVRRRLQRAQLREAGPGAEVPDAVLAGRLDEVHPGAGRVRARAVRQRAEIVKPIAFSFDERGRLWVIEAIDYPNRVLQRPAGRRPHQDPRRHRRRRPRRQVHGLRRPAQHPHEPDLRQRRRDRRRRAAHAVPEGHQRRRQGRRAHGAQHRLGHARHATPGRRTCSTRPTTTSGASSATPATTAR